MTHSIYCVCIFLMITILCKIFSFEFFIKIIIFGIFFAEIKEDTLYYKIRSYLTVEQTFCSIYYYFIQIVLLLLKTRFTFSVIFTTPTHSYNYNV